MHNIQISSDRIYLREVDQTDTPLINSYLKREDVCTFLPWGPLNLKKTGDLVSQIIDRQTQSPRNIFELAIVLRQDHKLIGHIKLEQNRSDKMAQLTCMTHPQFRNQGLATEAIKTIVDFGFNQLKLHRIFAMPDVKNIVSQRLFQRLKFHREGLLNEHCYYKEEWHSSVLFAVLDRQWRQINAETAAQ